MYYYDFQIVLQEVPGEISLCFSICGCKLQCRGCHSSHLWKESNGKILLINHYLDLLNSYKDYASCVLFMGGEWHEKELIELLKIAKFKNYKTCLYTGEERISTEITNELTFLKTGKWRPELGGLDSENTNQKFIAVKEKKNLNYLFSKN
ncbi:anaerobic ribonucleoside-triphosphate reductase activating protein [Flavicella marina]|uniref:anaerobic ribonucleoside-triphosphate reductase activating protein n=1 Tax=Flavicella marina TaxID=1475951 RepID=UPI0012641606|nr:anaerobic ribonucleoside-triphosphate reductase activating protein [Flavicella marina]